MFVKITCHESIFSATISSIILNHSPSSFSPQTLTLITLHLPSSSSATSVLSLQCLYLGLEIYGAGP
ncbi:hypothetical protein FPOAC2_12827 [Fusarium poae]